MENLELFLNKINGLSNEEKLNKINKYRNGCKFHKKHARVLSCFYMKNGDIESVMKLEEKVKQYNLILKKTAHKISEIENDIENNYNKTIEPTSVFNNKKNKKIDYNVVLFSDDILDEISDINEKKNFLYLEKRKLINKIKYFKNIKMKENEILIKQTLNILNMNMKFIKRKLKELKKQEIIVDNHLIKNQDKNVLLSITSKHSKKNDIREENKIDEEILKYIKLMNSKNKISIKNIEKYILAFKEYLSNINIIDNYSNIIYIINNLDNYFYIEAIPFTKRNYYINYIYDIVKQRRLKLDKVDPNKEVLKDVLTRINNKKYEIKRAEDCEINGELNHVIEVNLKLTSNLKELSNILGIDNKSKLVFTILEFYKQKLIDFDFNNAYINNKYISNCLDYFNDAITVLDYEYLALFRQKLDNCLEIMENYLKENSDKLNDGLIKKHEKSIINIISKIDKYMNNKKIDNEENNYSYEFIKYLINDVKSIEYLTIYLSSNSTIFSDSKIGNELFNEILETYLNIILNCSDFHKIIYYQKVIEKLISYNFIYDKQATMMIIHNCIHKKQYLDSLEKREDYEKRMYLINHTYQIINKIEDKVNKDELNKIIMISPREKKSAVIVTIDNKEAKMLENAFSVKKNNINGYDLVLYTSDISNYVLEKGFENLINDCSKSSFTRIMDNDKYLYSLNKDEEKDVIAFEFSLNSTLNVKHFNVAKQTIKVTENLQNDEYLNKLNCSYVLSNVLSNLYYIGYRFNNNITHIKDSDSIANTINQYITMFCNKYVTQYAYNRDLPLISKDIIRSSESINLDLNTREINECYKKMCSKELKNIYDEIRDIGKIYNPNNYNINCYNNPYCKVSSPVRDLTSLINQLLMYYYFNQEVDLKDRNRINFILDSICDEMNELTIMEKEKIKKLTKYQK